jgi:predicted transglutaminase-like protease
MDLDKYFVKSELIPAVIQEHGTKKVLMLAYMNKESLAKTLETGYTWFFKHFANRTLAGTRLPGNSYHKHSRHLTYFASTVLNAAARIRRLYTARSTPLVPGSRA